MISQRLAFLCLTATCLAFSIPIVSSRLQLASQNQTILSLSANTTRVRLGIWPDAPFTRHLDEDTYIVIVRRTPSSHSDPTPEMAVLEGISIIGAKVRAHSRLALIQDYHETEGPVTFHFHATEDPFKGSEISELLDQLWHMTNLYGKGEVYGILVKEDIPPLPVPPDPIAYFKIDLQKVSAAG